MAKFNIEFCSNGLLRKRFDVPANACRGLMQVPDFEGLCEAMPSSYWPAIQRGAWEPNASPSMPMRLDMTDKRGRPMGTLFATRAA